MIIILKQGLLVRNFNSINKTLKVELLSLTVKRISFFVALKQLGAQKRRIILLLLNCAYHLGQLTLVFIISMNVSAL